MGYQIYPQPNSSEARFIDYKFIGLENVVYDAYFTEAEEFFPGETFAQDAVMFTLEPEGDAQPPSKPDPLLGPTVREIFTRHFAQYPDSVVTYICRTKDKLELVRVRKFDAMFEKQNADRKLVKVNIKEAGIEGAVIYAVDNPASWRITQAARHIPSLV